MDLTILSAKYAENVCQAGLVNRSLHLPMCCDHTVILKANLCFSLPKAYLSPVFTLQQGVCCEDCTEPTFLWPLEFCEFSQAIRY
jgi:hypothetical protein